MRFPETRDETRITSHRAAGRDTDTKSRALASAGKENENENENAPAWRLWRRRRHGVLRAERVAARLQRRLKIIRRPRPSPRWRTGRPPRTCLKKSAQRRRTRRPTPTVAAAPIHPLERPRRGMNANYAHVRRVRGRGRRQPRERGRRTTDALSDVRDAHATSRSCPQRSVARGPRSRACSRGGALTAAGKRRRRDATRRALAFGCFFVWRASTRGHEFAAEAAATTRRARGSDEYESS